MSKEVNPTCTTDKEIKKLLEKVAHEEGFYEFKIEEADGSVKGDGYMGIITCIRITGKDAENKNKILHLIMKSASKSDAFRNDMPVATAFEREIYMYDTLFPTFRLLEIEKGLSPSFFAPKLYKVNMTEKEEAVVLENLKESGFKLHERRTPMDDGHVSLVMAEYGRFHALSFALRDQDPKKFAKIVGSIDDFSTKYLRETFFNTVIYRCTQALESRGVNTDQKTIERCKKLIDGIAEFLDELRTSVDDYSVALHGDCWTNNMMFKYEDDHNPTKPTQVRFIDFQVSKIGPAVLDLVYFFYACSSKEIFDNLDHYMQVYHNSLCRYTQKLGSDPDEVLPYSVLQQQWKKFAKIGLIMATLAIHAMLSEKDETIDLKDVAESGRNVSDAFNYEIGNADLYNDRIWHIVLHLLDKNFM